jgi:cytochrome c5
MHTGGSRRVLLAVSVASLAIVFGTGCPRPAKPSWTYSDFKEVTFDPFPGMSTQGKPVKFTDDELKGRIIWNLWTGDNGGFWDWLAGHGFGTTDLLKVVTYRRDQRFQKFGTINQPGYVRPEKPDEYGLYIEVPKSDAYNFDKNIDTYTYGYSSGTHGLRLFKNPNFNEEAKKKWDANRYFNDPTYYNDKHLVRPYVVGMTCSFCHTGPDPINPPADINEPEYANLNDYGGQHFMKVWELFGQTLGEDNFVWQLLHSNPAGALDTAFIATDYINNPGTMNGIYVVSGRMSRAYPEELKGGSLDLKNLEKQADGRVVTPRVLKEGADSVGLNGALSRVYLNIGEYWEEWITHFRPLLGGKKQTPIRVKDMQENSPHWNWSESHSPQLGAYLTMIAKPHKLQDAPGGQKYLTTDQDVLNRGKLVFAQQCASCHSSKQPPQGVDPDSDEGKKWFEAEVMKPDFLDGNFLASEVRYPVRQIKTNASRAVATNGLRGHVWDNFTSETYKTLPPGGPVDVWYPFEKTSRPWEITTPGLGYYRPASLVSMWTSAPFLHNNALGKHVHGGSVDERMDAFNDAVTKLLWPENRLGEKSIWRTTQESWIKIPKSYVPEIAQGLLGMLDAEGNFRMGPIPKGTPINLLANLNLEPEGLGKKIDIASLLLKIHGALSDIKKDKLEGDAAAERLMKLVPDLYELNSCPDFIMDKGHLFGTELPDRDKKALVEYMKYM